MLNNFFFEGVIYHDKIKTHQDFNNKMIFIFLHYI